MRKILDCSISLTKFYENNKDIIKLKRSNFFNWIVDNYYAIKINDKYIATQEAVENGFMINKNTINIDIEPFRVSTSYRGYVTQKGQEHILDIFEKKGE